MNLNLNPLKKTSVDSITAGFSKTATDLESLITRLDGEIAEHNVAITELEDKVIAARDEKARAKAVLDNLNKLISKD